MPELQIIYRDQIRRQERWLLAQRLSKHPQINGTLYLGYPDLNGPPAARIDALLVEQSLGVIIFKLNEGERREDAYENLSQALSLLTADLVKQPNLRLKRALAIPLRAIWLSTTDLDREPRPIVEGDEVYECGLTSLAMLLVPQSPPLSSAQFLEVQSVVQHAGSIRRPIKEASRDQTLRYTLSLISKEVSSFDRAQLRGALEMVEGPQRIRGLAGSGKTIVIARKAAEIHRRNPERQVVVVHFTRSVKAVLEQHIERFLEDTPWDRDKLRILPAMGSVTNPGVYALLAQLADEPVLSPDAQKRHFGHDGSFGHNDSFGRACEHVAAKYSKWNTLRIGWEHVLVDEAQDLPPGFFKLLWSAMSEPHRIVWAYDELQNLFGPSLPGPQELFGSTDPSLDLTNREGEAHRDVTLEVCYRTPPWILVAAHAVGLGMSYAPRYAQWVEQKELWEAIGYDVEGDWRPGEQVCLKRAERASPSYFGQILQAEQSIRWAAFESKERQDEIVVNAVARYIREEGLAPEDVMLVLADTRNYKSRGAQIQEKLREIQLGAIIAGESLGPEVFRVPGSVTISGVHRAKGNEAPMVIVLDAGVSPIPNRYERSELFIAMTRSSAWLRVVGVGDRMQRLVAELEAVKGAQWSIRAQVPTDEELADTRRLGRDLSPSQRRTSEQLHSLPNDELRALFLKDPALKARLKELLGGE